MKKTVGARIVQGLKELTEAMERGEPLEKRLTCHTVQIELKPGRYGPRQVKATRVVLGASQSLFARFLGVSIQTVRA
jgi:putative transcriptional regulator